MNCIVRGQSMLWIARRIQHLFSCQDVWSLFSQRQSELEDYIFTREQHCNLLQYEDSDSGEVRYRTIVMVDDAAYAGSQGAYFLELIKKQLDLQCIPDEAKVRVIIAYAYASDTAVETIRANCNVDQRLDVTLITGGHISTLGQIIKRRSDCLADDLAKYETSETALQVWLKLMYGPKQNRPDHNAHHKWSMPAGLEMWTTILAHKVPDDSSLFWSYLVRQGLGGQKYGLVNDKRFY